MNIIIPPHKLISREVTNKDMDIVRRDAPEMIKLCHIPLGKKSGAFAIAHCQVEDKDPLRFFVTHDGDIFINPKITKRFLKLRRRNEGCMSYPNLQEITINRDEMIEVFDYRFDINFPSEQWIPDDFLCRIFQHEIDHFNGITIYNRRE